MMRRRDFIVLLGGAASSWPLAARAQQATMPVVGYLYTGSPDTSAHLVAAFRSGLGEVGYLEGRNVTFEYRWAHNENDRMPEPAADLVRRNAALIFASAPVAAQAAKAATTTIPIVFRVSGDPVEFGLVASLNRPGGNMTGVHAMSWEVDSKRLGLLHELLPEATRFAVLVNPNDPNSDHLTKEVEIAASAIHRKVEFFPARAEAKSTLHLRDLCRTGLMHFSLRHRACSLTVAFSSSHWPLVTFCREFIRSAILLRSAD